ncbi:TetR family transcriptional regulator [Glutamicibacter uratoxydans]|uniref:TetR family transcriptional regulator n=1 Tax=Glutamicibacter uratoxydans TaxID=43667 RepID=A0A4Y4DT97_GLUUR|nr:TetR family transcriptional regulator [Glutamicibacter uratoxydans]GED06710.1 TetR family transcriptional regulator [Glutamicibacter uratoxydans]
MTTQSMGTRREKNKQATREAILNAVSQLLHDGHGAALTATQIADAAGISRRTLFNYFPTVDAIISYPLHRVLETMVDSISELTDSMPLMDAIVVALKSDEVADLLGRVALFGALLTKDSPSGCYPSNMDEWQKATSDVVEKLARRSPNADGFAIRVFTHALLGAGQAAFDEWIERLPALGKVSNDITDAQIAEFHTLINQAMSTLDQGLSALPLSPSQHTKED